MDKRIGLLTWHYYDNFGSALQAYALQHFLEGLGYQVDIINYRNPKFGKRNFLVDCTKNMFRKTLGCLNNNIGYRFSFPFLGFRKDYLKQTKELSSQDEVKKYVDGKYWKLIYGSDQIWAPNVINPVYLGAGIKKTRKYSYAASIGLDEIPIAYHNHYKSSLEEFDAISVRERQGKKIIEDLGITSVKVVLDPTLLLEVSDYNRMEKKPKIFDETDFVFCYFLNENNSYDSIVEPFALENNCNVCGVSSKKSDAGWMKTFDRIGPCEFLWLIDHAKYVFTDSYHGAIFSMLYHKRFYLFERFSKDNPINQNSRIYQLDNWFGIKDRIISDNTKKFVSVREMDYDLFEKKLKMAKAESVQFIRDVVSVNA